MQLRPALLVLSCLAAGHVSADDWNQWRGPHRDGAAHDSPPLISALPDAGLKPVWVSEAEIPAARSGGWSSPVVVDGRVYVFTHQRVLKEGKTLPKRKFPWLPPDKRGHLSAEEYAEYERNRRDEDEMLGQYYRYAEVIYCLDADTGKTLWTNDGDSVYTRFLQSGTPAIEDGRIFVLGAGLKARCIDAKTGESLWQTQLPGEFRDEYLQSSFAVADGVAVVLARQLFALDASTGEILWSAGDEQSRNLHTSPTFWKGSKGTIAICNVPGGETIGVDLESGQLLWRIESEAGHSTPIVAGDRLLTYGGSRKGGLRCYRLSHDEPELLWKFQRVADSGSSPVVVGDLVFVQGERRLACVDLETGEAAWQTMLDLDRPRYTSLIAADAKVIYAFDGVLCFAADDAEYRELMKAKIDKQHLLAEESMFRKQLDIDQLQLTAEGQAKAERLWQKTFSGAGPLTCTTPAIAEGRIYFRLKDRLACYDLRAGAE